METWVGLDSQDTIGVEFMGGAAVVREERQEGGNIVRDEGAFVTKVVKESFDINRDRSVGF